MNAVRKQIDSYKIIVDALSNRITSLSRDNGDTIHGNTDMQDSIQGFGDRILKFEVFLSSGSNAI